MGGPAEIDGKRIDHTDNFHDAPFMVDGVVYCSVENYFQTQKSTNAEERDWVRQSGPGELHLECLC